jgi:hypothetical protein
VTFACEIHQAYLYDRGGVTVLGYLGPISRVRWERMRDDVSHASVNIATRSADCDKALGLAATGRTELVIFRGDERVWEGPITHITYKGGSVEIQARDVVHYLYRTIMKGEYDNRYPNNVTAIRRLDRIIRAELARMEAQVPPINVLPYLTLHETATDAGTSSHTLAYEDTVFGHLDKMAARGGLDYCTVGRAIHLFDVDTALGQTAMLTAEDFIGDVIITEYGMELATFAAVTDGNGRAGVSGAADAYYGLVEILDMAYDEDVMARGATPAEGDGGQAPGVPEPVSIADLASQAQRNLAGRNPAPIVVRVPDNSTLNPQGAVAIVDLVPGVWLPLQAELPGRSLSQIQKLDKMTVEETADGETIQVTLHPAPLGEIDVSG